jgi:hypothetical protein
MMFREYPAAAVLGLLILTGCASRPTKPVENLGGANDVSSLALKSLEGIRDGERLEAHALYGDDSRTLKVDMLFNVTPPARLVSGTWSGLAGEGTVRERSVTFLGGQSGPPSLGGRFDLIGPDNRPQYRVTVPLQELKHPR